MPDGVVCTTCWRRLLRKPDRCDHCKGFRVLPGRSKDQRLCSTCIGVDGFSCASCGRDDEPMDSRIRCRRCASRQRITTALALEPPLAKHIDSAINVIADRSPEAVKDWIDSNPQVVQMIRGVHAAGRQFSHDDVDSIGRPGVARNLRQAFVTAGLIEYRHHGLDLFDTWAAQFLSDIADTTDRQTLRTYIRWSQRRRLEAAIELGKIKAGSFRVARRYIRAGDRFLGSLRAAGGDLASCEQSHVDSWFANGNTNAISVLSFLAWAQQQRLLDRRIALPVHQPPTATGMPTDQRIDLIRHLLTTETLTPGDRLAGLLVAVYAQPISRISRMRLDDIDISTADPTARLGATAIALDPNIAAVAALHLERRRSTGPWLFPGKTAGRPVSANGVAERLRPHGVTKAARISALHDLTRSVPSTILADLIGYNRFVVANRADALGEPWQHYAALSRRRN